VTNEVSEQLRCYVETGCEDAFRLLVERHVGLVYGTALRKVGGDAYLAEDITQLVFCELARKARGLPSDVVLAGWLYRSASLKSAQVVRTERRRSVREQIAVEMQDPAESNEGMWQDLAPLLDAALDHLSAGERDAVILRFFQNANLRAVGEALGLSEDAAQKRVSRALERLRSFFSRHGIVCTSAGVAVALATQGGLASLPVGLVAAVTTGALASAKAGATAAGFQSLKTLAYLTMTKFKIALMVAAIAVALTPVLLQHRALERLRLENARLANEFAARPDLAPIASPEPDQESKRLRAQASELLKLPAEVARLRQQQTERSTASTIPGSSKIAPPALTASPGPEAQTNEFSSEVQTPVNFGETVVTGGWATSPGHRVLVFVRPELRQGEGETQSILLRAHGVELAEAMLTKYGMQDLATISPQTQQHGGTYANSDADQLMQRLAGESGTHLLTVPVIQTLPGRSANILIGNEAESFELSATPTLMPAAGVIDLKLNIRVRPPQQSP
jgi:RNA polymerase sigma factor (sigma-70 family)